MRFAIVIALGCSPATEQAAEEDALYDAAIADTSIATPDTRVPPDTNMDLDVRVDSFAECTGVPMFDPPAGDYETPRSVRLFNYVAGSSFFYTTDGSEPSPSSTRYVTPIAVEGATRIRAMATAPGFCKSGVSEASYTVADSTGVATVAFEPSSLKSKKEPTVSLFTVTIGATICYAIDAVPACDAGACTAGDRYSAPFVVATTLAGVTVRALACKAGAKTSPITQAVYTLWDGS